ncbi:hypothetical protein LNQ81_13120 [Myroides sp. M-43]|uniref:hypothetical protein n=1 Tax=Myroides oncorhynchi TaxID=2893756 RepID=UPI001E6544B3|nr:hypothetical protein [Myroides oncorhynchi]MCC9043615.1 hypothetical protein [Myroides oncorhynchi]
MKNNVLRNGILLFALVVFTNCFSQQVAIGNKQQFLSESSILEFPDNDTRGLVLPMVNSDNMEGTVAFGTLIYDIKDKKVKYLKQDNLWVDLSINTGEADSKVQDNLNEIKGARTLIGNDASTTTEGVLVLDSSTKAMVLPRVESPHLKIVSPPAGTIVYDTKSNMLCVFNGKQWAFWAVE